MEISRAWGPKRRRGDQGQLRQLPRPSRRLMRDPREDRTHSSDGNGRPPRLNSGTVGCTGPGYVYGGIHHPRPTAWGVYLLVTVRPTPLIASPTGILEKGAGGLRSSSRRRPSRTRYEVTVLEGGRREGPFGFCREASRRTYSNSWDRAGLGDNRDEGFRYRDLMFSGVDCG